MRKWLILLFAICVPPASAAPAWTWVDAQGQVHYSDRPVPGAKQIDLPAAQSFPAPRTPQGSGTRNAAARDAQPPDASLGVTAYRSFNIVSPTAQETLWNIGGNLPVLIELAPGLRPGHAVDIVLDGQRLNLNADRLQLTVPNVFRGAHTIQAAIVSGGDTLLLSPSISFVVQQTSIQNPNNPNAARSQANRPAQAAN
jgi:hypothetical protein